MKGKNIIMSCNNRNLRNLDTNIYSSSNGCCDTDYEVKMVERLIPCYVYPPRPMPPFEPIPQPPHPPVPPFLTPTAAYALFYNNSATGATYAAEENIAYQSTLYNTATTDIVNNNGLITLSGGTTGKAYLVNYQVTGETANDATLALAINGTVDSNSEIIPNSTTGTSNGSYIVNVPANSTSTVALRVVSGTVTTASPTVGSYLSVIRIA